GHRQLAGALRAGVEDTAAAARDRASADREVGLDTAHVRGLRGRLRDSVTRGPVAATPATPGESEREGEQRRDALRHQYVRSIGCHFVTVTGFQLSFGAPSSQVTIVWRR